jgi:hypothetical protein
MAVRSCGGGYNQDGGSSYIGYWCGSGCYFSDGYICQSEAATVATNRAAAADTTVANTTAVDPAAVDYPA